jgi:hypothetical protein
LLHCKDFSEENHPKGRISAAFLILSTVRIAARSVNKDKEKLIFAPNECADARLAPLGREGAVNLLRGQIRLYLTGPIPANRVLVGFFT